MKRRLPRTLALLLAVGAILGDHRAAKAAPMARTPNLAQTQAIVGAARAFLETLRADQRQKVEFPFAAPPKATLARFARKGGPGGPRGGAVGPGGGPGFGSPPAGPGGQGGPEGRGPGGQGARGRGPGGGGFGGFVGERYGSAVWSNYPVSDVPRPGLRLGELNEAQKAALMRLLQTMLSAKGYRKVQETMESDQALSEQGQPFDSGIAAYTVGMFGAPSTTKPWMVQFGGHHLGLNVTIVGERGTLAPTLTGAQPAVFKTKDGRTVRALAAENDKAFVLLDALDGADRKAAILNYEVGDLMLGPGHDGETVVPEGLKGSAMNKEQKALLLDLIAEWAGIVNDRYAKPHLAEIAASLNDTYFAWSGPTTHAPGRNGSSYYRIQGPRVIIEFSPQGVGGDATNHVHTVYRDPKNEYGRGFTTK